MENDIFYLAIPGDCFDYCSRWLFWMSIPVDWFDDYIDQKRLYGSEVSTTYYLNDAFAVERLLCNSTTDSYFSDRFVFLWPIPISTNHWPDDWFIFERELSYCKIMAPIPPFILEETKIKVTSNWKWNQIPLELLQLLLLQFNSKSSSNWSI